MHIKLSGLLLLFVFLNHNTLTVGEGVTEGVAGVYNCTVSNVLGSNSTRITAVGDQLPIDVHFEVYTMMLHFFLFVFHSPLLFLDVIELLLPF